VNQGFAHRHKIQLQELRNTWHIDHIDG
jgi:hypothetical protein